MLGLFQQNHFFVHLIRAPTLSNDESNWSFVKQAEQATHSSFHSRAHLSAKLPLCALHPKIQTELLVVTLAAGTPITQEKDITCGQ